MESSVSRVFRVLGVKVEETRDVDGCWLYRFLDSGSSEKIEGKARRFGIKSHARVCEDEVASIVRHTMTEARL